MNRKKKKGSARLLSSERGQAFAIVLIFLVLGSLTLTPLLSYLGTVFQAGGLYQNKTDKLYAADSGIEDATWQIKYNHLNTRLTNYNPYDFDTTWTYDLDEPMNNQNITVGIQNIWMPTVTLTELGLSPAEAEDIIERDIKDTTINRLIVTGTNTGEGAYRINLDFYPAEDLEDPLEVASVGIWLPLGFTYNGNCNLEGYEPLEDYYQEPTVSPYKGGQAVVWQFSLPALFTDFPGVNPGDVPMSAEITFEYTLSQPETRPAAISWIITSGVLSYDIPISWDADIKIYRITSTSGGTTIESYVSKCEIRKIGSAISGDYRAVGNSLMTDTNHDWFEIRDELLDESDAEVTDIPSDAEVVAAYLYWSGWFDGGIPESFWQDDCADFDNWDNGSSWSIENEYFKGHNGSGQYLTMENSLDLSSYPEGSVVLSWEQWEDGNLNGGDKLQYEYSGDGGSHWSTTYTAFSNDNPPLNYTTDPIPSNYRTSNFKFRFKLTGFNDYQQNKKCYVDNFAVCELVQAADTSVVFKINGNQVYLDEEGDPQTGDEEIVASDWATLENQPGQYSYSSHRNVTELVQAYSNLGDNENHTGNGFYTVGGVSADTGEHWSYAGWSLIIVYSSCETAGHQLYLYDNFAWAHENQNLDFDGDGEEGGHITGFIVPEPIEGEINAATLTCFVAEGDDWIPGDQLIFNSTALWDHTTSNGNSEAYPNNAWNSQSVGMTEDGMDIDNFYVTWESGLLEPGETSAQLDLPTGTDNWNLIYIILSFRTKTVTRGTSHYVVHGG
jgi:hypothetical protein